jgi:hypothetical protein
MLTLVWQRIPNACTMGPRSALAISIPAIFNYVTKPSHTRTPQRLLSGSCRRPLVHDAEVISEFGAPK